MNDLRECPVDGCSEQHDRKMLMCRDHWFQVPKPLRSELWGAYKNDGVFGDRYQDARTSCIEAVTP